jgi:hypothetical protein
MSPLREGVQCWRAFASSRSTPRYQNPRSLNAR